MEPVAISWLVASATSPLIAVLALWTVYVFHTYRKRWRTVDLFLLAITSQELVAAVFNFGYAIISLINPPIPAICSFIHWGLISVRTFQISTLTSTVVDRALTVRWPYRYRFSVRRNQIRYHIAVLALMAILVGVAAVFAHNVQDGRVGACSTHPRDWDFKFIVFVLGFYAALMLITLACAVQIEVHKCRNGGMHEDKNRPFQLPDCTGTEAPVVPSVTSPLDNDSHTGSTKALHRTYRHSSRRPYNKKGKSHSDFRWPPVAVVSLVCFSVNHLPYLVLTSLATAMPWLWSPWHEALLSWLRLAEGVLVPLILCIVDQPVRTALKRTFQRRSGALSPLVGDDGPFQMYFDKDHFRKRGTFGSVTPIGIITNYRRTPGKKRNRKCKYKLPGLHTGDSVIEKSCLAGSFLSTEPISKLSCADLTALEVWQEEEEENFYATLSDDFSNFSINSIDETGDDDKANICDDIYGGSFTTIANDDFEFHDTRPCGGEVRMKPAMTVTVQPVSSFRSSIRSAGFMKDKQKEVDILRASSTEKIANLMNISLIPEEDKKDPNLLVDPESSDVEPDLIKTDQGSCQSPASLSKATSFSMNDLDLIEQEDLSNRTSEIILPIKSESTLSLYRLGFDISDEDLPSTKSETNVNIESGHDHNPPRRIPYWPGYPARKLPDSNYRKPGLPPGWVHTKQYPGVLHPRMQKIPWISAWKKIGGNIETNDTKKPRKMKDIETSLKEEEAALRMMLINDNFELRQKNVLHWKDSIIYTQENAEDAKHNVNNCNNASDDFVYGSAHYKERHARNSGESKKVSNNGHKSNLNRNASLPIPEESPYGKLKSGRLNTEAPSLEDNCQVGVTRDENIYEEIINEKSRFKNIEKLPKSNAVSDDKSYAQTDILKLVNISTGLPQGEVIPEDYRLNININSSSSDSSVQSDRVKGEIDTQLCSNNFNVGVPNVTIQCPASNNYEGKLYDKQSRYVENPRYESGMDKKFNCNNRVHVSYNVNDSALEFIDDSDEKTCRPTPYDQVNDMVGQADFNANSSQTYPIENQCRNYDMNFYNRGVTSVVCRKNSDRLRSKETNVSRRDSKKLRRETAPTSEVIDYTIVDNFAISRRESDKREKLREIKRRESGSRSKRENNLARRESDPRSKKSRPSHADERTYPYDDAVQVHRSNSRGKRPWTSEAAASYPNVNSEVGTCIQVEDPRFSRQMLGHGISNEQERLSKDGFQRQGEFQSSNGVIRLHCNYQDDFKYGANVNRFPPSQHYPRLEDEKKDNENLHNPRRHIPRSLDNEQSRNYIELCYEDGMLQSQIDHQHEKPSSVAKVERRPSDKKIRRKVSSSRSKKDHDVGRKESFKSKANEKSHAIRRLPDVGVSKRTTHPIRRTNSFQTTPERNANLYSSAEDFNRNESVKLNTEHIVADEHVRMDNLVYGGRRDNGNATQDVEVFPFETFAKPPSYNNLMKHHCTEHADPVGKERYRQKKIAITDYL